MQRLYFSQMNPIVLTTHNITQLHVFKPEGEEEARGQIVRWTVHRQNSHVSIQLND